MEAYLKILLLEDNEEDAEIIQRLLEKKIPHTQFQLVMTKKDYIQALKEFHPNVILSDNSMPQFSASEALSIMRGYRLKIPFIMVTGNVSEEFAANMIKEGADDYILKDRMARLPAAIEGAINKKIAERERHDARLRLAKSEERYRSLYERNYAGVYRTTIEGNILNCNNSFANIMGYGSPSELEQKNASILYFSGEDRELFIKYMKEHTQVNNYESVLKHKDGHAVNVLENISLVTDPESGEEIIEGVVLDITRQKKADETLKKTFLEKEALVERMSTILDSLPANIALLDKQGIIIDINDAWRKLGNTNCFVGKNYPVGDNYITRTASSGATHRQDGKIIATGIKDVLDTLANNFECEYPCHSKEGERWFRMIVTPLHEKKKSGAVVMHLDITEQKKNATALATSLKDLSDYKIALDESSIVSITDQKGILTFVNDNFCAISKYSRKELLGNDCRIVNSSFHGKEFIKKLWTTILEGKVWRNEMRNKTRDGELYWVDCTIVPFLNNKGKPIQYVAINKDITEKKVIEQKLVDQKVQEQKRITRAMIIAQEKERNHLGEELHDNINQILAGTKLYLGMAGNDNPAFKELIKYPLELIDSSIQEIRLLCQKLVTPLRNIDLDQMVRDLLDSFTQNTKIQSGFSYSLATLVLMDDLKLNIFRIIQEQINNIVKYAKAKNVNISITEKNKVLSIIVTDDGIGFNINIKRKGIGISNMIHRIESYNGELEMISSPGNGCTIALKIPC